MSYTDTAQVYADQVRALFTTGVTSHERGTAAPADSPAAIADEAKTLVSISSRLIEEASSKLSAANADERMEASNQLLAKALTDLTVSSRLLQLAEDEENGTLTRSAVERSASTVSVPDDLLKIVVGDGPTRITRDRMTRKSVNISDARQSLSESIEDTLDLVSTRTASSGQTALAGLLGLGPADVGQAAGLLGQSIAGAIGQAEKVTQLYGLVRQFVNQAYESVLALLGPALTKIASQQVVTWLAEVKEVTFFALLLEKLYQTKKVLAELLVTVNKSDAHLDKFDSANSELEILSKHYTAQIALVDKLLKGLRYLSGISAAVLPYGTLLMAAAYIALLAYVVFNGADYVDANFKLLDRVAGVRRIVTANLGS